MINYRLHFGKSIVTAAKIVMRYFTSTLFNATLHEVRRPNLSHIRFFGCSGVMFLSKENQTKLIVKLKQVHIC